MLIRSQDKAFLLNFNNLTAIYMEKIDKDFDIVYNDFEDAYTLGKYSTEAKAMKVLYMIQEAYERYEYEKVFKTGLTLFETFQMPEDSEVEV